MFEYNIYELSGFDQCGKILYQGSPSGLVGKSLEGVGDETVVCVETDEKVITVLPDKKIARDRIMYIRDCVCYPIFVLCEIVLEIIGVIKKKDKSCSRLVKNELFGTEENLFLYFIYKK